MKSIVAKLLALMTAVLGMLAAGPAAAQYATGGSGQYRSQILWFDWGVSGTAIPQVGTSVVNTITISGTPLVITCTLSGINGNGADPDLQIYRPGGYFEDGLDDLYNVGGTGGSNTMDIGLINRVDGTLTTFTYSCSALLGGSPYVLDGLVFADAETTSVTEAIRTTLPAGATMRVIERNRAAGCTTGYNVNVTGTTYAFSSLPPNSCSPANPAPMGVYFIDNATTATLTLQAGGLQAVALGVMLNVADYGDAPSSYGTAGHLPQYNWSGGTLPAGNTDIFSAGFSLATLVQPTTALLGSRVDVENPAWAGAGASLDDSNGAANDEDGVNVSALAPLSVSLRTLSYSVPVACVGTGFIAGWIDFDRNGVFDADERSATVNCSGGSATLAWTVNPDTSAGQSYLRVRTAASAALIASATGIAGSGEAEDYALTILDQTSFGTCDARMWLEQSPGAPTPTTLYQINTTVNPLVFNAVGTATSVYNAVGYNPSDNYQYGLITNPAGNTLVRVGADGSTAILGAVTGLPSAVYISGAFGTSGNILYVKNNVAAGTVMYAVNITTLVATPITLSSAINIADWAWVGGLLYSVTNSGQLVSVNPTTGAVTNIGVPNGLPAGFFGAIYGAPNGLYGSGNNPPSGFYQFDLNTGAATLISGAPGSSSNDGSNCPTANITFGADLAITKTNTPGVNGEVDQANDTYAPGTNVVYTIVVSNSGPFGAQNATVADPLPAGITTASWTCTGTAGGVCTASGSGAINDATVDLPVGGSVTYLLTLTVPANFTGALTNTATVTAGAGTSEANTANNQATDSDVSVARLTIAKTSLGGVGSFGFTGSNGVVPQTLTTTVAGTPVSGAVQTLTALGTVTTVTEAAVAGFTLTDITCTGLAAGGNAAPDLGNRTVTLDAAATAAGANIVCTFTNSRQPVLRLQKALPLGRFVGSDQFALTISGAGGPVSVTTTGTTNTPAEIAVLDPATLASVYTLSEAGAAGANLANYVTTYACTNASAGGQTPSGSGSSFSVTPVAGDDLTCTLSNTRNPLADLIITKTNTPGVGPSDQAGDTVTRGATTIYTIAVTNNGPDTVTGAVLSDPAAGRNGLTCTAPPTCSGAACPAGLTLAQLESGVALGALANGASVVVTLTCTVN
ncbi:CshA/CshB family fibrillar adhesin-related protein [Lysobacter antibioticus]|uniref:CshA/CshB family fibrillar adhesin-related protein n=1 Tax=Lysobacter antibioticus TaxID=84531 RepID=UPI00126A7095|nr:CshA/CshB family fibrillar adhesin-related protein [Lysobacter antibioticus]